MSAARFPAAPPRDKPTPPPGNPRAAAPDAPPPSRSSPSLLERFRSMLRDREDELRSPGDEELPPLAAEDVVPLYEEVLSELIVNSKPVITELTIIAGEQREHAEGIADAICSRILEVPYDQKLPCLYLLDSIVKNIGSEYVRHFQVRLYEVFCRAYNQVPPNFHLAMRHLFGTWTPVFSSSVRRKIQSQLEFASPERQQSSGSGNIRNSESSSPHLAHSIHVNPKYVDAHRQFDRPVNSQPWDSDPHVKPNKSDIGGNTMERNVDAIPKKWHGASSNYHDVRKPSETFTGVDLYERKSLSQFGDYNLDQPEVRKSTSTRGDILHVGMDASYHPADSKSNHLRHSSPKAPLGRLGERNSWQGKKVIESDMQRTETNTSYDIASKMSAIRSRELIDAYGNGKGKSALSVKPSKIQKLEGNMLNSEVSAKDWQTSEEDEYVWEDMSPTLADRNRGSILASRDTNFGSFGGGPHLEKPDASILGAEFRRSNRSLSRQSLDIPTLHDEVRASSLGIGPGSKYRGPQNNAVTHQISHYCHEPWTSHYKSWQSSELNLNPRPEERMQLSFSRADVPLANNRTTFNYPLKSDTQFEKPFRSHSEPMNTDTLPLVPPLITAEKVLTLGPTPVHIIPSTVWPSSHKLNASAPAFVPSQTKQYMERLSNVGTDGFMVDRGIDTPFSAPWQPSESFERQISSSALPSTTVLQNPSSVEKSNNESGVPHLQLPSHQDPQGSQTLRVTPYTPSLLPTQSQVNFPNVAYPNASSHPHPTLLAPVHQNPLHVHSGPLPLPPLPPGPPPAMIQTGTSGGSTCSTLSNAVPSGFSGLISSLMSQGLISLMPQPTSQDSLGFEFNPDQLKIRHEPAINDLYVNLPRQCTTCGLRFKCQEEHRSHMDWHVTKNRMSKNRKQKSSRKWFVSSKEWLSGAETLGVDAVPGFLPTETVVDKNEEKELAVPADENQNLCALCGEQFEDFYSDEADEWMYKGAVYLNAPEGSIEGLDKFQLGPIVHAKCRTESSEVQGQA